MRTTAELQYRHSTRALRTQVLDWPTKILSEELNIIVSLFLLCAVVLLCAVRECVWVVCVGWVWNMMELGTHGTCRECCGAAPLTSGEGSINR